MRVCWWITFCEELACEKDLKGKKVVVSAGATQEPMDPVRYLTNHSTGKMGYAVARACMLRGADVTLLASTGCTLPPGAVCKHRSVHHRRRPV